MFLAVIHNHAYIVHRIPSKSAAFHRGFDAFFNRRQIGLREIHTDELIREFEIALMIWLNAQMDFPKLTRATRLFLVTVLPTGLASDAFAIGDPWLMRNQPHLEFHLSPMDSHINMLVSHTLQDRLMCNGIVLPGKGHI